MSLTVLGIKGVATDFMDATPSATVAFQAVSAPVWKGPPCNSIMFQSFIAHILSIVS